LSRVGATFPQRFRVCDPVSARGTESTRIQLCGRLSVEFSGVQLADLLRGRQARLLLAYLLLNRARPVGREELIGALWPEHAPVSEDAALRTLLSRVRSALGAGALNGREELVLTLPEPVWVDLEAAGLELERAMQALDRADARGAWALAQVPLNIASRGLLPGVQASWLEPRRRELEEIRLRALEVIGEAGLRMGGPQLSSVERAGRALIESEPYRESGYVLLIEALAARGNVAEGLRVFDRLRTLLRHELGTTPSAEAIAMHDRLLRPEMQSVRAKASDERAATTPLPAELRVRSEAPMVGRRNELGELLRFWESVSQGSDPAAAMPVRRSPQIVCLAGDAGIGKTRLAAELARRSHDVGAVVLAGRAPREAVIPYQPFLEALRLYSAAAPLSELRAAVGEFGGELARLIPELSRRLPDLRPAAPEELASERYRLFESVVGLLSAIASKAPILLILDDLQWADRPTLLLLRHLARASEPSRLLTLISYRSEESEGALADALVDLRRDGLVAQLEIGGLHERETAELVRIRAGEAPSRAIVRELQAITEGNPFFIEETVRHLVAAGVRVGGATASDLRRVGLPEGVKETIALRLARLQPETVDWLRVASVIGRDFDSALVEQLMSSEEEQFLASLEEAIDAGLLVESSREPGHYSFSHALVRETLYDGMSAQRRARIHGRVAEALEAGDQPPSLGALAYHFTRAGRRADADKAIAYAVEAAGEAISILAYEDAVEHYSRALELLARSHPDAVERRCELLLRLGEARVRCGEVALAREAFREAAALAEQLSDSARLARAAVGASRPYVQPPGVVDTELIAMLERSLELTAGELTVDRVRLLSRLCGAIYYSPERSRMTQLSEEAMRIADALGDPEAAAHARAARRRALWDPTLLAERLQTATEMLGFARTCGNLELQLHAHAWLVVDLLESGDRAAVEAQIEAFTTGAERLRQPLYLWQVAVWHAMRALLDGKLQDAEQLAADALAGGAPGEGVTAAQYYAIQLLAVRREQGRMDELEQAARQLVEANPARPAWRAALGTILWETDRVDEAHDALEHLAASDFTAIPRDGDWLTTMTLLCDVYVAAGDLARAAVLYDALLPYANVNVVAGVGVASLGPAARILGKLAATINRGKEAARHFERALEISGRLSAPVWLAHTQLDYAAALGRGNRATELASEAAETAQRLGLTAIARQAAALEVR
jgi:DNA-binding SARP family transcriptional activator/tetratricopeptide (TPR) repeat protein